jgi:hypothetical protein
MSEKKFEVWINKIQEQEGAYAYRYIYDAYISVKNNCGSLYYRLVPEPNRNLLMNSKTKEVELEFESKEEKAIFSDFIFQRFCGHSGNTMEEWHQKRMYWYGESLTNWE